ncbi:hypothetical protein Afil01_51950 [Actinorhabdospora filicis]|uniref:Uncharacterized protein n=1 Tax=Actinorhabdospora filicis TaxID=1785913 RepID=A0A9W6SQA6_9ACTN|nr:hypothetical protein [Actinorhabdospora filicis]GLZ80388.1 hypothetical protein Afil01_51950 [Actinorhabdospora filicis]
MHTPAYLRLVRASAWYDLVITAAFATPWTYALAHRLLTWASEALGLGAFPPLEPMQTLYANLMGSVVVVWALLRLRRTLPAHGLYDASARALFSLWMAYALAQGAPGLLWGFLAVEIAWGVAQAVPGVRDALGRRALRRA